MVITRLHGGLGNQLFQYSAGRRLAHTHDVSLKMDLSPFESYKLHKFSLDFFAIRAEVADRHDLAPYGRGWRARARRKLQQLLPVHRRRWIVEPHFHFEPGLLAAGSDVYLEGYWQSEKYFRDIRSILLEELRVKTPPSGRDAELIDRILGTTSVSVHVRRADYVGHATHGVCSVDYYIEAMRIMRSRSAASEFFLFSDDPEWAKKTFSGSPDVTIVDHNDADTNYEDFRLMMSCKHHIIANSTFSWWAAWLSDHPEKRVIAPRKWFAIDSLDTRDLVPDEWQRV